MLDSIRLFPQFQSLTETGLNQWMACCPVPGHDDRHPSLAIAYGSRGQLLLYCHAGCSLEEILAALDVRPEVLTDGTAVPVAFHTYEDRAGLPTHRKLRFPPKSFRWVHREDDGTWKSGKGTRDFPLYRTPQLQKADPSAPVFIPEGEKDVDRLVSLGLVATTDAYGANVPRDRWQSAYAPFVKDRDVVLLADNDGPGRKRVGVLAQVLVGTARTVRTVTFPDLDEGGDVSDFLDNGGTLEQLLGLVEAAPVIDEAATTSRRAKAQASRANALVEIATEYELFHAPGEEPYARLADGRVLRIGSQSFTDELSAAYYQTHPGEVIHARTELDDAVKKIASLARVEGLERDVFSRVARVGRTVYLDAGESLDTCLEVTAEGWRMVSPSPVMFLRRAAEIPFPLPDPAGDLDTHLRPLFDPISDFAWRQIEVWLIATLYGSGTLPVLFLNGPKGSGKTSVVRVLRAILDPRRGPRGAAVSTPRSRQDLFVQAANNAVLVLDNVSYLDEEMQDAICQMTSGAEITHRKLYSDDDAHTIQAHRSVIITSIVEAVSRGDLLDRALVTELGARSEIRTEREIMEAFEARKELILGGLLNVIVAGFKRYDQVETPQTRLADVARFIAACEGALGWRPGTFTTDLASSAGERSLVELENSVIGPFVLEYARKNGAPVTATGLHAALTNIIPEKVRHLGGFPKNAVYLGRELRRIAPALAEQGVHVTFPRRVRTRWIEFTCDDDFLDLDVPAPYLPHDPSVEDPMTKIARCFGDYDGCETCSCYCKSKKSCERKKNERPPSPDTATHPPIAAQPAVLTPVKADAPAAPPTPEPPPPANETTPADASPTTPADPASTTPQASPAADISPADSDRYGCWAMRHLPDEACPWSDPWEGWDEPPEELYDLDSDDRDATPDCDCEPNAHPIGDPCPLGDVGADGKTVGA